MINLNGNIENIEGEKILEHLESQKEGFFEKRNNYAKMGIYLPPTTDHLDKSAYLYLYRLSHLRQLSETVVNWMKQYVKTTTDPHIKRNFN